MSVDDSIKQHGQALYSTKDKTDLYGQTYQEKSTTLESVQQIFCQCIASLTPSPGETLVFGDYGAACGVRSMDIFTKAIEISRKLHGEDREIMIVYNDLPSNDFNGLFQRLAGNIPGPKSYLTSDHNVYVMATGKSMFARVMPAKSLDIIFSSYAVHYLSKGPCVITNGLTVFDTNEDERLKFKQQAAEDWKTFLLHRADELKPGGVLIVTAPLDPAEEGDFDLRDFFLLRSKAWKALLDENHISKDEYVKANRYTYYRTVDELRRPFDTGESQLLFAGLHLESIDKSNATFLKYEEEKEESYSKKQFVADCVAVSLSVTGGIILDALNDKRTSQEKEIIMKQYESNLTRIITESSITRTGVCRATLVIKKM